MKALIESIKQNFWAMLFLLFVGFSIGKFYSNLTILSDCRVLGMTRFGDIPMGCRVGEAYK